MYRTAHSRGVKLMKRFNRYTKSGNGANNSRKHHSSLRPKEVIRLGFLKSNIKTPVHFSRTRIRRNFVPLCTQFATCSGRILRFLERVPRVFITRRNIQMRDLNSVVHLTNHPPPQPGVLSVLTQRPFDLIGVPSLFLEAEEVSQAKKGTEG
jgi:hypothetical protein